MKYTKSFQYQQQYKQRESKKNTEMKLTMWFMWA